MGRKPKGTVELNKAIKSKNSFRVGMRSFLVFLVNRLRSVSQKNFADAVKRMEPQDVVNIFFSKET